MVQEEPVEVEMVQEEPVEASEAGQPAPVEEV